MLLFALVVVPMAALFAIGSMKRDLFELRYFAGAVPALLLLGARVVTATTVRRGPLLLVSAVVTAVPRRRARRPAAQRRRTRGCTTSKGRFDEISDRAEPGDVVLYEPSYLAEVVGYYAPGIDAMPVGSTSRRRHRDGVRARHRAGAERRGHIGPPRPRTRRSSIASADIVDIFERPNVRVWELQ